MRDSLAQTLNTEIMDTIQKLDNIGNPGIFQRGGHVAHVHVAGVQSVQEEQYSSSTSGVYSEQGSEGSNSPEYNSWRSAHRGHHQTGPASHQRWSVQGQ